MGRYPFSVIFSSELQRCGLIHLTDYAKKDPYIFIKTGAGAGLTRAMTHAARLRASKLQTGGRIPATDMDILVKSLRMISPEF